MQGWIDHDPAAPCGSATEHWLHDGDRLQSYDHTRDAQGVLWDFVEVFSSGAPTRTPASERRGAGSAAAKLRVD